MAVSIFWQTAGTLELHARGGRYDTLVPLDERRMEHHLYKKQRKFLFTCVEGRITQTQQWDVVGSRNAVITIGGRNAEGAIQRTHCVLESYRCVGSKREYPSYDEAHRETKEAFDAWERQFRGPNRIFEESRRLAAPILPGPILSRQMGSSPTMPCTCPRTGCLIYGAGITALEGLR